MSIQGTPRVDRDTAERLVAGQGAGPVAVVLRAAAAPAHVGELAGESAAVAAFREAANAPAPHRSVFRRSVAKALTIKAVLVVAVAGSTGVVLAASEGALPVPWSNVPADAPGTTTPVPNAPIGRVSDDRPSPATPDPAIVGLCEAYTAGEDKDLDTPAFQALVDAAGGEDEVAEYCEIVETTAPSATAGATTTTGKPEESGKPEEPGEDARDDRQPETPTARTPSETGRPSERPGGTEPPTEEMRDRPTRTETEQTSDPSDEVTETPDSSAPGAASAVPPSGAEPPSKGS
ncbi:hypothetical protein [Actinophytocola sp. NPDC049390]|uniref:hypothetical protein n=1 Tax=Actinophytocola sp. NPDC049390 TaxID=3363894 RepID=UPI00378C70CC